LPLIQILAFGSYVEYRSGVPLAVLFVTRHKVLHQRSNELLLNLDSEKVSPGGHPRADVACGDEDLWARRELAESLDGVLGDDEEVGGRGYPRLPFLDAQRERIALDGQRRVVASYKKLINVRFKNATS
jgi:hypothetical protein